MLEVELIRNIIANADTLRARGIERYPESVEALELLADSIGVRWLMEQANNMKADKAVDWQCSDCRAPLKTFSAYLEHTCPKLED